ncbi:MAG: hypothetical protein FWD23_09530 [Oscillospiraceae bacterium]|nr:hypothetical protein [Oscillospiraceae bacterium]
MKKMAIILFAALLTAAMCIPVSAINPFQRITATEDNVAGGPNGSHETKEDPDALYDASKTFNLYWDTDSDTWAHGGVNTIAFLSPYGIGYGHKFGTQYIENLDFGANGANKVTVALTYPDAEVPFGGLAIYLDVNPIKDKSAKPIGTITGVLTDGFEEDYAKDYSVDVDIPGGVHTVYFMYMELEVGSFFSVEFTEAPPPPAPEPDPEPEPAAPAEVPENVPAPEPAAPAPAPAPAPATGDAGTLFAVLAILGSAVVFTAYKKVKI